MAMRQHVVETPLWTAPIWPETLPTPDSMRVVYGAYADELVIGFFPGRRYDLVVVVPVNTPDHDYAGVMVDGESRAVVGVHVYPLMAFASRMHPSWAGMANTPPAPETIAGVVDDIKSLLDRYGAAPPEDD